MASVVLGKESLMTTSNLRQVESVPIFQIVHKTPKNKVNKPTMNNFSKYAELSECKCFKESEPGLLRF